MCIQKIYFVRPSNIKGFLFGKERTSEDTHHIFNATKVYSTSLKVEFLSHFTLVKNDDGILEF